MRTKLPGIYEEKYKSEYLKNLIVRDGLWQGIRAVNCTIDSEKGLRRIAEHDMLFSFLDDYFPDGCYDFEPNMQDGRFMAIPQNVFHQGIALTIDPIHKGELEFGIFWYPSEFTSKMGTFGLGQSQSYIDTCSTANLPSLAELMLPYYDGYDKVKGPMVKYCTFPLDQSYIIRFEGNFLDDMPGTKRKIMDAVRGGSFAAQKNGEYLIFTMEQFLQEHNGFSPRKRAKPSKKSNGSAPTNKYWP